MTEYIIPYQDAESEFTEKRSRFITHLYQVKTEAEARTRIEEMKKKYYDARHNCWCYLHPGGRRGPLQRRRRAAGDGGPAHAERVSAAGGLERLLRCDPVLRRRFAGGGRADPRLHQGSELMRWPLQASARMGLWTLWDVPCTYPLL